jgi:hypothetical protein
MCPSGATCLCTDCWFSGHLISNVFQNGMVLYKSISTVLLSCSEFTQSVNRTSFLSSTYLDNKSIRTIILFNANSAIFQLSYRENKLSFNKEMTRSDYCIITLFHEETDYFFEMLFLTSTKTKISRVLTGVMRYN